MEQMLLSRLDVAKRWGKSTTTVDRYVRDGKLTPVEGFKSPQFNIYDVIRAEGGEVNKLSPYERRRLEKDKLELEQRVKELEEEKEQIRRLLTNTVAELSQTLRSV